MSTLSRTHTSVVTPDQIDHLGHMNVRYYASNARQGTRGFLAELGIARPNTRPITDIYTRHHHEQLLDAELEVRSGVLSVDDTAIRIYHELANAEKDQLAATFVHEVPLNEPVTGITPIDIPAHGATRSIDLRHDPVATAPSLDTVRSLNLALRRERTLGDIDCEESDQVAPHMVTSLIWGGEQPSGGEQTFNHVGPNGENIAWATMETRLSIAQVPNRGTRIQSFSAATAIANKTTQMSMWAYDIATGEILVAFELVNLMFNIDERRSMPIPPDLLEREQERLHAALAPSGAPVERQHSTELGEGD